MSDRYETKKQYHHCPVCGSDRVTAGTFECDSETAWVCIECEECDATWEETFVFAHSDSLRINGGAAEFPPSTESEE